MRRFLKILGFIWQLPQNIAAGIYYFCLLHKASILMKEKYKGIKVFVKCSSGSITLGEYIFVSPRATDITLQHEYGHTRQSLILGPLYLIIIGLPSITWAMCHKTLFPHKSYYWLYTEYWANKLAGLKTE